MREKYIKRTYRISKENDSAVKNSAKKKKQSESQVIRSLITNSSNHEKETKA